MPHLKSQPTLEDIQVYVKELQDERGFNNRMILEECLKLGEEMGELFKSIRVREGMKLDRQKRSLSQDAVEDELADILIYLCSVANYYGIDLEQAFREKEEKNKKRVWQ